MTFPAVSFLSIFILFLQFNRDVERLKENPVPVAKEELSLLNRKANMEVYRRGQRVFAKVSQYSRARGPVPPFKIETPSIYRIFGIDAETLSLKVDDGWIVAYNMGEFGGMVNWYDNAGQNSYVVENLSNVLEFVRIGNKIYAVSGLAHMGTRDGSMTEITRRTGKWMSLNYLTLPDAPLAITVLNDKSILTITVSKLLRVHPDKEIEVLIDKGFWSVYLHPKSIVVSGKTVYAGMAGGVMKTTLTKPSRQIWMTEE